MDSFLARLPFLAAVWWIFVVIRRVSEQVECIGLRATFPHLEPSSIERNLASIIHCMGISQNNFTTDVDLRRREFYRVQSFLAQQLKGMRIRGHCYAGHCGPWLEDIWRSQFSFDDVAEFGVFVPLFVPWLYLWLEHGHWYSRFLPTFANFLSRDFLYITMSQNDDGVEGQNERLLPDNVFVISAGGKGNVPFLLLGKPYSPLPDGDPILYDVVLMGSLNNHWIRPIIAESMPKLFNHSYLKSSPDWISKYRSSKVVLCPRGYGRNSFRLTETLQLGLIPVYAYNDALWLPYYNSIHWEEFSFILKVESPDSALDLNPFKEFVDGLTPAKIRVMRQRIRELHATHFSREGAFDQVRRFLRFGFAGSDLRCAERRFEH